MSEGNNSACIDLSGLDDFEASGLLSEPKKEATGHMFFVPISDIEEDPEQPRKEFDQKALVELAESMRSIGPNGEPRGVKSPLSVKPKNKEGKYIINHGARRFRAANMAELSKIPIFVDPDHDKVDQVIENIQREDLSPLEISHFVQERLDSGEKKKDIAKSLGKPLSFVSDHAMFFEFPDCVRDLYDTGRCRTIQALSKLHRAHKSHADVVEKFCRNNQDITYAMVNALSLSLKAEENTGGNDQNNSTQELPPDTEGEGGSSQSVAGADGKGNNTPGSSSLEVIKKPLLLVLYEDRTARMIMNRRVSKGFGWIKYDDTGEEEEVELKDLSLKEIMEG